MTVQNCFQHGDSTANQTVYNRYSFVMDTCISFSNCEMCDSVGGISFQSGIKNRTELENLVYKIVAVTETHFISICVLCDAFCCVGF